MRSLIEFDEDQTIRGGNGGKGKNIKEKNF